MRVLVVMATACAALAGGAPGPLSRGKLAIIARPNVILVLAAAVGYDDLACHGNPRLRTPNSDQLYGESVRLSEFFSALPWWTLQPCHELVRDRADEWTRRKVLAKSASGDLAVAYLPGNNQITVNMKVFPVPMAAKWFNPLTGGYQITAGTVVAAGRRLFARPTGWQDALLVLRKEHHQ